MSGYPSPSYWGCEVSVDWQVDHFSDDSMGHKDGGYWTISKTDQRRLDALLSHLPDDGTRLPPPNRRVVLQVPEGDHCRARVYDRANAPDEILEILRLSQSSIGPWVQNFDAEGEVKLCPFEHDLYTVLTPPGLLVSVADHTPFMVVDPVAMQVVKKIPTPKDSGTTDGWYSPDDIQLSPNRSQAAVINFVNCWILDTRSWQPIHRIEGRVFGGQYSFSHPRFTADGRTLLLRRYENDSKAEKLVAYNTRTWAGCDVPPELPDGTLDYIESCTGKRAIILQKDKALASWNLAEHKKDATLAEHVESFHVAFSPDDSMVAIASERQNGYGYRIRIWKTATGQLIHELYPFQLSTCIVVEGMQWTPDAKYVFAAARAVSPDNHTVDIWGVHSGRLLGILNTNVCMPLGGIVMLPDGRHLAVSGSDSGLVIRRWDFAAALKKIETFEESLPRVSK